MLYNALYLISNTFSGTSYVWLSIVVDKFTVLDYKLSTTSIWTIHNKLLKLFFNSHFDEWGCWVLWKIWPRHRGQRLRSHPRCKMSSYLSHQTQIGHLSSNTQIHILILRILRCKRYQRCCNSFIESVNLPCE